MSSLMVDRILDHCISPSIPPAKVTLCIINHRERRWAASRTERVGQTEAPQVGLEPTTLRLTVTLEECGQVVDFSESIKLLETGGARNSVNYSNDDSLFLSIVTEQLTQKLTHVP
jgi:hypothetical protein